MTDIRISYNPYTVQTEFLIDGREPERNNKLTSYQNRRLQEWIDDFPGTLLAECNDSDYRVTFHGTELDYQDLAASLDAAKKAAEKSGELLRFELHKESAKEYGEKEKEIRQLFERMQALPFEELRSKALKNAFDLAFNSELEVNVVATMSAGKSTLINALLGAKLMPTKSGACTATVTRITDNDMPHYQAKAYTGEGLKEGRELVSYPDVTYELMKELNANEEVSEIHVKGNIPFVTSEEVSLVLIDTPGPNSAIHPEHGKVTEQALQGSSKMLVLFVMNGRTLNDTAQDKFLEDIAKSMRHAGKQARERFLFVINQMDACDDDDDIKGEILPETVKYLKEKGIEDPYIFPLAAKPALQIRTWQNASSEEKRQKIERDLNNAVGALIPQQQLHLEQYSSLPSSCRETVERELEEAKRRGDKPAQALVHSGIRSLEEMIRMYVTKYTRPAKITNVVRSFEKELESAEAFQRTKDEISSQTGKLKEYSQQMERLQKKLSSRETNDRYMAQLSALNIETPLDRKLNELARELEAPLAAFFEKASSEMAESEAMRQAKEFEKLANKQQNKFQVVVERLLKEDVEAKSQQLLEAYIRELDAISEEFSGKGLKIDLKKYVQGSLATLNPEEALNASYDSRIESHTEDRTRTVTRRRRGLDRLFHPSSWFNPYYDVTEHYQVNVDEKVTFISREKLSNNLIAPVRAGLYREVRAVSEYAADETKQIKDFFTEQFRIVNGILAEKAEELRKATSDKNAAEQAKREAEELLQKLEEIRADLNRILEI